MQTDFNALSIPDVFSDQTFLAQTQLSSAGANLVLYHEFKAAFSPSVSLNFGFEFKSIGLIFPLAVTSRVVPQVRLRGSITLGTQIDIEADFNVLTKYLTVTLTDFPSFGEFVGQFSDFVMGDELVKSLPLDDFSGLGSIILEMVSIDIDFAPVNVDRVRFIIAAEKPLSLIGDIVQLQPTLVVQIDDPFKSSRQFDVGIYGRWLIAQAEINTALVMQGQNYQLSAQLGLDQPLSISHLLRDVLGRQISGIPNVSLVSFEFSGIKEGADTYYAVELDILSGWHLDILPLAFDAVHLEVEYANKTLTAAYITATLEFCDLGFTLSATYDPNSLGWTFGGGTVPGERIAVGAFIIKLASELGINSDSTFLKPFENIQITNLYVEYSTSQSQSAQFLLFLSLETSMGRFNGVDLQSQGRFSGSINHALSKTPTFIRSATKQCCCCDNLCWCEINQLGFLAGLQYVKKLHCITMTNTGQ